MDSSQGKKPLLRKDLTLATSSLCLLGTSGALFEVLPGKTNSCNGSLATDKILDCHTE